MSVKIEFRDKDRFSGQEFDIWSMRMQVIFEEQEIWDVVTGTTPEPAPGSVERDHWLRQDRRARNILMQGLDRTMIHHTLAATTAHGIWSRLCHLYQAVDSAHKMAATKNFHMLTMKEGEQVERYVSTFRSARARLASCGTLLTEIEAAEAFIASLPPAMLHLPQVSSDSLVRVKLRSDWGWEKSSP